jgi:hypothetical protein
MAKFWVHGFAIPMLVHVTFPALGPCLVRVASIETSIESFDVVWSAQVDASRWANCPNKTNLKQTWRRPDLVLVLSLADLPT